MSWPTTNEVQRANAGEISVAPVGHIAAQTTEAHPPIADPLEAPTEIGPPLAARRVAIARRVVTARLGAMARPVVTVHPLVTTPAAAIATVVPTGERTLLPRAAHRVVTVHRGATADRGAIARPVVTAHPEERATAEAVAPRAGARAMVAGTRAIARSALLGVNATAETRAPNRHAWTSPIFRRT